ncbi:MAG: hypothetical protein ABMA01_07295, partial [Chthoniobacteraceae bacterium]
MRKTFVIAAREYLAAVNTKAFIISLVLLPLLMGGGFFAEKISQKIGDQTTKQVAVLDRTPNAELFPALERASEARNASDILDKKTGKQMHAKFAFERVDREVLLKRNEQQRSRLDLRRTLADL